MDEQNPIAPAAPEVVPTQPVEPTPVAPVEPAPAAPVAEPVAQPIAPAAPAAPAAPVAPALAPVAAAPAAAPAEPAPKKSKKGLVAVIVILLIAIAGGVTAALLIPMLNKVAYGPAYRQARDLKSDLDDFATDQKDCYTVVSDIDKLEYGNNSYNQLVDSCKNSFNDKGLTIAINNLGETDAVKKDKDIKTLYDDFNSAYQEIVASGEGIDEKLEAYRAMHKYLLIKEGVFTSESYRNASTVSSWAQILIDTDIEEFVTYGEGWKEKLNALADAYYSFNGIMNAEYYEKKANREEKLKDYRSYVNDNEPDVKTLFPLKFADRSGFIEKFEDLKDLITTSYEENYDEESGDCAIVFNIVHCE